MDGVRAIIQTMQMCFVRQTVTSGFWFVLGLACLCLPSTSVAQEVKRCRNAQGMMVYTDKPCHLVNAAPVMAKPSTDDGARLSDGSPKYVRTYCPNRTPDGLVLSLTAALQARDVNRLAGLFHWVGTGSRSATARMQRLQRMADRATVEVRLVYVQSEPMNHDDDRFIQRPPQGWPRDLGMVEQRMAQRQVPGRTNGIPRVRRTPIHQPEPSRRRIKQGMPKVEVSQQLRGGYQVERQVLGLRKHAGCVWLTF